MEGHARTWFTPKQKAELWERWKSGQCVADIARALERRNKSGVYRVLAGNGGIAPAPRRRALVALRLEEREEISRGIAAGRSIRRIAQGLERSPSTVSREIRRNGGCSAYRASEADKRAWRRALRPKPCRLARHAELRWRVAQKLVLQWSPEQISGWLKRQFPADPGMQVSHETTRPWASKPLPIDYEQCCSDQLNPQRLADIQPQRMAAPQRDEAVPLDYAP